MPRRVRSTNGLDRTLTEPIGKAHGTDGQEDKRWHHDNGRKARDHKARTSAGDGCSKHARCDVEEQYRGTDAEEPSHRGTCLVPGPR